MENNSQKIKLQVSYPNFDKVVEQNLEITKTITDNEETYNISIELIDGEDTKTINFLLGKSNLTFKNLPPNV